MTDWPRIVREHGPLVFGTAWRILGHVADVEDVVQEVFLQAYQLQQTRPVRYWSGLLRRLAACRALDRLRQRKANLSLDDYSPPAAGSSPEAEAMGNELRERLRLAIAELPAREAEVFCLRYFEDLPYDTIAETLGIRRGAVAAALHKARAKLEASLVEAVKGE
jgi:RNA polymerase sigma-70 factor (ECF subfamily)